MVESSKRYRADTACLRRQRRVGDSAAFLHDRVVFGEIAEVEVRTPYEAPDAYVLCSFPYDTVLSIYL